VRTRVYVTVDVECAEERLVRGKPQPALGYDLRMWGSFRNQREDLGIPLLVRELDAQGFKGTFYVEPFGSAHFGIEGLAGVVSWLGDRGHDVQLHAHPIQRNAAYRSRGDRPQPDDIGAYTLAQQVELLEQGKALLVRAGARAEDVLSFRAGNFGAANETWTAMRRAGLVLSSNYNPCYFGKNCKMRTPAARPGLFASPEPGVWELPITCFAERGPLARGRMRHLQIAAVSAAETIHCLRECRSLGISEVTIVTHSFELYFIDSPGARTGRPNSVNLERLRAVLAYLRLHDDEFEVDTCGALARRLADGTDEALAASAFPEGRARDRVVRFVEQARKRAAARVRVL